MTRRALKPWTLVDERLVFEKDPFLRVYLQKVMLPDGRVVEDYLRLTIPNFVIVVAETVDGEIVMERSYKNGLKKIILETPAGMIEENEAPLDAAKRELLEETGYEADSWTSLGVYTLHANYGCGKAHFFAARNARRTAEPNSGDLEEMEIFTMKKEELYGALDEGGIELVSVAAAIALAKIEFEKRRASE